jgi:hypothetical protein
MRMHIPTYVSADTTAVRTGLHERAIAHMRLRSVRASKATAILQILSNGRVVVLVVVALLFLFFRAQLGEAASPNQPRIRWQAPGNGPIRTLQIWLNNASDGVPDGHRAYSSSRRSTSDLTVRGRYPSACDASGSSQDATSRKPEHHRSRTARCGCSWGRGHRSRPRCGFEPL